MLHQYSTVPMREQKKQRLELYYVNQAGRLFSELSGEALNLQPFKISATQNGTVSQYRLHKIESCSHESGSTCCSG